MLPRLEGSGYSQAQCGTDQQGNFDLYRPPGGPLLLGCPLVDDHRVPWIPRAASDLSVKLTLTQSQVIPKCEYCGVYGYRPAEEAKHQ